MKGLTMVAGWLLVLGGLSLGLSGLMRMDLLVQILGDGTALDRLLDLAIGASALLMAYNMLNMKKGKR